MGSLILALGLLTVGVGDGRAIDRNHAGDGKLDAALWTRAHSPRWRGSVGATSRVILRTVDGKPATHLIESHVVNGKAGRFFSWLGGQVAEVPDHALEWLAEQPEVVAISLDRAVRGTIDRTARTIGARWVTDNLGVDGSGIGVATIDSGVSPSHDDLQGRVVHFADFVNLEAHAYDDYGHGTHVAGIIAGSGHDSGGERRGVSPGANLIVLKALDVRGTGFTSNVIAAIDYAIANQATYNIRVLNLSVAAGVYESFWKDPLALAAKRAVDAGIVVVAAAGNRGLSLTGHAAYAGIASPGNAPWVLTVGASSDNGTAARGDDVVAGFSSRGPAAIDLMAKPDLVAPGVGIESTTDPTSALYKAHPSARIWGSFPTPTEPYLSLTGTSMSAPVVTGTVALMFQANPTLTPNSVKAILQFTAETRKGYNHLTQGAGFLNARGSVELARAFVGASTLETSFDPVPWNRHIIWGNYRIGGGMLSANSNAWRPGVTWGDMVTPEGEPIDLGTRCRAGNRECAGDLWRAPCDVASPDCDPRAMNEDESASGDLAEAWSAGLSLGETSSTSGSESMALIYECEEPESGRCQIGSVGR
jgi:serine protease AprX